MARLGRGMPPPPIIAPPVLEADDCAPIVRPSIGTTTRPSSSTVTRPDLGVVEPECS